MKSNPLDLLAVFSATAGNFNAKFCALISLIICGYQQHLIVVHCLKIIGVAGMPPRDFLRISEVFAIKLVPENPAVISK